MGFGIWDLALTRGRKYETVKIMAQIKKAAAGSRGNEGVKKCHLRSFVRI
jgi:hypothetical protein